MNKNYQTSAHTGRITAKKPPAGHSVEGAALPDTVTVAIADQAGELEEGLLAFAVGTGLKVLDVILEQEAPLWPAREAATTPNAPPCATAPTQGS